MPEPHLILKSTPPRAHRMALPRPRLMRTWAEISDRTVIEVCASGGFGKTTLLVHWRRAWLEKGALVAWLALDDQDDPTRFGKALFYAMRVASGRGAFDTLAQQYASQPGSELDALTGLLAEIASLATLTILILDDAERLPEATVREALAYLLYNAPPNLHVVIGTRAPLPLPTWELAAHGNFAVLRTSDLRLDLDESIAILGKRFGGRLTLDDCVRLHEATEGWPIGLQLAASAIEHAPDLSAAVESLSARHGDIERYFIESLLSRLPPPVSEFLTRIAILEDMTPELCEAVTGCASAAAFLDQLLADTPILIVGELRDWIRPHPLARDFLLGRFEQLPLPERNELHHRAARWLAERQRFHDAARHALAAGDESLAHSLAERGLWTLATMGKLVEAREWLERLPPERIAADVQLRLVAGWIMAMGGREADASRIAEEISSDKSADDKTLFVAALVGSSAAAFADRIGAIPRIMDRWAHREVSTGSVVHVVAVANTLAVVALHEGDTERVRELEARLPTHSDSASEHIILAQAIGRMLVGLSHLWDGDARKAEATLRPALAAAERDAGRRSVPATMLAAALAAALFERDQIPAAQALLANRLDIIERSGVADSVLAAYRTLAAIAASQGDERRALDLLRNLRGLGDARRMPRLRMVSFAEEIRMHATRSRAETASALLTQLEALAPTFAEPDYGPFLLQFQLATALARVYVELARFDLDAADAALKIADGLANSLHRHRDALTVKVLRAVVARQRGEPTALRLLAEAQSLAAIGGIERLLADTHPLAAQMGAERKAAEAAAAGIPPDAERAEDARTRTAAVRRPASPLGGLLTPKEAEVLTLLDSGLSNKLIANTMDISDETVKWHLKNLFSKLSAGTRKHAVDRARLLGLVGT
jgi:LuxR family maltose regulon positive regulatory protein